MITIAIADDHTLLRKALVSLINDFTNCQVIMQAGNGQELLDLLAAATTLPQVAILDVNMPFLDGYHTARALAAGYPQIHTLSLSMLNDELNVIKMLQAGVKGYVLKECDPEELQNAILFTSRGEYFVNELLTVQIGRGINHLNSQTQKQGANDSEQPAFLTERETEFLQWTASDYTYKEIADKMKLSPRTIDSYRDTLFEKLQIRSRVGLAVYAIKNKVVIL
ncbi:two component transcriptional regulator, LuxR family [Filimonas lacunae]|uniref:Two component transcriptional regulator, LuxR family n=1 Tax=Filimonas lacunae TaxID=477680 RepID=A0A173MLS3_9BACT|nr:response regulator transcription factor [Filimonas lacunae]BAV08426.1 two-component response regulator [Filimonas lacunae]SIT33906.1 two component transcriptional regulator, LuxR family [Filimonas lacunae]